MIVTTFTSGHQQTLPIWMLSELIRPRRGRSPSSLVFVIAVTFLPILGAYYPRAAARRWQGKEENA